MSRERKDKGDLGEELAAQFLVENGYDILARQFIYEKGEVDIIAQKENVIAFVEVKMRSSTNYGLPQDFVKPAQIKKIINCADYFMQERPLQEEARFDIIAVILEPKKKAVLDHIKDAFYHF